MTETSKIEFAAQSDDIQIDIEQVQNDIDAEGYDITVGHENGNIVLTSTTDCDLENMISEEAFRECYLGEISLEQAIGLITYA